MSGKWISFPCLFLLSLKLFQVSELFALAESKTGVQRIYIAYGLLSVVTFWLMFGWGAQLLCNAIGFAYPAYCSIKVSIYNSLNSNSWAAILSFRVEISTSTFKRSRLWCVLTSPSMSNHPWLTVFKKKFQSIVHSHSPAVSASKSRYLTSWRFLHTGFRRPEKLGEFFPLPTLFLLGCAIMHTWVGTGTNLIALCAHAITNLLEIKLEQLTLNLGYTSRVGHWALIK